MVLFLRSVGAGRHLDERLATPIACAQVEATRIDQRNRGALTKGVYAVRGHVEGGPTNRPPKRSPTASVLPGHER